MMLFIKFLKWSYCKIQCEIFFKDHYVKKLNPFHATGLSITPENVRKTPVVWNGLLDQTMVSVSGIQVYSESCQTCEIS